MEGDEALSEEILALEAIYPELEVSEKKLALPVELYPTDDVTVLFKFDSQKETYVANTLPDIKLTFLVDGYPEKEPPYVNMECYWLDSRIVRQLEQEAQGLWTPGDQVLFSMIDHIKSALESMTTIVVPGDNRDRFLASNQEVTKRSFNAQTFKCEICQMPKKGVDCTVLRCDHVFCTNCLQEYYTACITQGYIAQVICPEPQCSNPKLDPETLKSLVPSDLFERYDTLRKKKELQASPHTSILCPRNFCQDLIHRNPDDNLTICGACGFAFCAICKRSWHGYFERCRMTEEPDTETLEAYINGDREARTRIEREWGVLNMKLFADHYTNEKLFREYLEEHAGLNQACPECRTTIERSGGCNKMTCGVCHTFFCFRCGSQLSKQDPYSHYGNRRSPCFEKLFEGMEGTEDLGFRMF
ncbi:E3 ubiquitin-protein ligase Itt1p [Trichomonascus vanleenenianus]|uniref:RBR-type E3 ubiquitin transferase n=1 Tax=Trichomonascus vanleenenianus TaxID=2268995 RepID=UPI003ECB76F4